MKKTTGLFTYFTGLAMMPALAMNPVPTIKITDSCLINPVTVRSLDDTYKRQIERSVVLEAHVWQNCLNDLQINTVYLPDSIESLEFETFLPLMQACAQKNMIVPTLNALTDDELLKTFQLADSLNCRHIYKKSSEILKQRLTHPLKLQKFMAQGSFGFSTSLNNETVLRLSRAVLKNHPGGLYWLIRQQATENKNVTLSVLKEYELPSNKEVAKVIYGDNNNPYFMIHYTDGTLTILDKKNCNELILEPKLDPILYAQFCKDQPFLTLLTYAGKIFAFYVFDYKTGKRVIALRHEVPEASLTILQTYTTEKLINYFLNKKFYCFDKNANFCALFFPKISSMLVVNIKNRINFNVYSESLETFTFNDDGSQCLAWHDGIFINGYNTQNGTMMIYKIPFIDSSISSDPNLRIKKVCFDNQNIITVWLQNGPVIEKWKIIDGAWQFVESLKNRDLDDDYQKECATYDQADALPQAPAQGCEDLSCAGTLSLEKLSCRKLSGSVCPTLLSTSTNFTDKNNLNLFDLPLTLQVQENRCLNNPIIVHCSDRTLRFYQVCNPETEDYMLNNLTLEQTALLSYAYECKKNKWSLDFSLYPKAFKIFEQLPTSLQKTLHNHLGVIYPHGTTYRPENDSSTSLIKPEDAVGSNIHRFMTHIIGTLSLQRTSSNPSNDSQQ